MEGENVHDVEDGKDGFSFRPQRQKLSAIPKELKSASIFQQPKKWSSVNKNNRGSQGGDMKNFPLLEYPDFIQAQLDVEEHFNKTFTFSSNTAAPWSLPPQHTMFTSPQWQDDELQQMKASLNATKHRLGEMDVTAWQAHTNNTNPAQKICYAVRRRAQPEMVTQAWLKFYEIVNAYSIVVGVEDKDETMDKGNMHRSSHRGSCPGEGDIPFNSLHLCEAPGAFITALNHYLALNAPSVKWEWLGNTLNPYYEGTPLDQCVTEDRFIYLTRDHWLFGKDNTGDLTKRINLASIEEQCRRLGPIHLVTGDGSFDCQVNPAEQESMTHPLHLCEATAALSVLSPGGALVLKKFTFFESHSLCLMYLLCCVFQEVHLFKPGTSKQGNSEVYLIGQYYKGREVCSKYLEKLLEVYGSMSQLQPMFAKEDLPEDFLQQMRRCSATFMAHQVKAIMRNLNLFDNMNEQEKQYNELLKSKATGLFFERNFCVQIPRWKAITQGNVNKSRYLMESDWNKTSSSLLLRSNCLKSKLEVLHQFLETFKSSYNDDNPMDPAHPYSCLSFTVPDLDSLEFEIERGKPLHCIESSKFCSVKVLRVYRELHRVWLASRGSDADSREVCGDDSLVATVMNLHPGVTVVRDEARVGPHPGCQALEDVVVSLEEELIPQGGSMMVVGAHLLSRLQYSLLLVVAAAFKAVRVYAGQVGSVLPVLLLDTLKPGGGELVVRALHRAGWSPGCSFSSISTPNSVLTLLQLVGFTSLLSHLPLQTVHHYNSHLCSHLASTLRTSIISTSEILP